MKASLALKTLEIQASSLEVNLGDIADSKDPGEQESNLGLKVVEFNSLHP